MVHAEHSALIETLAQKVEVGPPTTGFPAPYFQACWALIKRIGPSFKEVRYPDKKRRDSSYARFQNVVGVLKQQQGDWEKGSEEIHASLLARMEAAAPALTMAELAGPATGLGNAPVEEAADPYPTDEGMVPPHVSTLTPAARRMVRLQTCSDECKAILDTFMAAKARLTPAHYKEISDTLRILRQAVQNEWDSFKDQARNHEEKIKAAKELKAATPKASAKTKAAPAAMPVKRLEARKREEQARLDHLLSEVPKLEAIVKTSTDEARVAKTGEWLKETLAQIAELEESIRSFQAQIDAQA